MVVVIAMPVAPFPPTVSVELAVRVMEPLKGPAPLTSIPVLKTYSGQSALACAGPGRVMAPLSKMLPVIGRAAPLASDVIARMPSARLSLVTSSVPLLVKVLLLSSVTAGPEPTLILPVGEMVRFPGKVPSALDVATGVVVAVEITASPAWTAGAASDPATANET